MRFMCTFCQSVFDEKDISVPMEGFPGSIYIRDSCPRCGKGNGSWYASERQWEKLWYVAVRYQKNIRE